MRYFCALTLLIGMTGCGSDQPEVAPVTGTVTFEGQPLKKGTIVFESPGNRPANGRIEDGKIVEVTTFKPGDGAAIGSHKIAVFALETAENKVASDPSENTQTENYMGAGPSLIPDKYNDPTTSGLTVEIKAGEENTVNIELN